MNSCTMTLVYCGSVDIGTANATEQCAHNTPTLPIAGNTPIEFQHRS